MNKCLSFFCVSVLIFLAGFSPLVFSQENISVDVTAERETEEVPLSSATATVITADEIAESGASGIVEILEKVPGIAFRSPLAGPGSEEITMRGFGDNAHGRVLVLVDGNRMNNPDMKGINWNAISLMDIERIEILDGSASVRYGNNAVAGVINIITKKTGKTQTNITLSAGSFWNNQEGISHQQSTDWGRFSISAEHLGSEGYRDRSAYDTANAALQGTIDFTDKLSLSLKGSFADLNYEMPGSIFKNDYDDNPTTALNWNDEASEHHISTGVELEWVVSDTIDIQIPLSYQGVFTEVDTASWFSYINRNTNSAEAHPAVNFNFAINEMPLNINAGADFYYAHLRTKSYADVNRKGTPTADLTIDEFNSGYFLTTGFKPLKTLSFNAGVRYDFITVDSKNENTFKQAFVYEAGAAYKPFDFINVYTKYSSLFRFPFTDEMIETYPVFYVNDDLKPESGFNVEGGIIFHFDKWITLNANIFYMKLTDEIAYNGEHNQNLDRTQRIGTNASLLSKPLHFLELQGTYSYVNAEFTNGVNKGNIVPLVSAHQISGTVAFVLPWNIKIGIDMDYRGPFFQGSDFANNLSEVDGYFLLGASVSYSLDNDNRHWMILFQVKNLLNTTYSPYVTQGYQPPDYMPENAYYPGNGREFNLSVQYRF